MRFPASFLFLILASCGQGGGTSSSPGTGMDDENPRVSGASGDSGTSDSSGESGGCGHSHDVAGALWATQEQVLKTVKAFHKTQQIRASEDDFWVQPLISDLGERQVHVRWKYMTPGLKAPLNEKVHEGEWICALEPGNGRPSECRFVNVPE
ncbi:MAG: hypothetical protein KGP28_12765 [Bdellovibrionales bacterium]|nr:hypothetical protein [Bdellovibrionales bacterium]